MDNNGHQPPPDPSLHEGDAGRGVAIAVIIGVICWVAIIALIVYLA